MRHNRPLDPTPPARVLAFRLGAPTKQAAVDAGVGGAAASRVNPGHRPRRRTAAEPSTPASSACEHSYPDPDPDPYPYPHPFSPPSVSAVQARMFP